MTQIIGELKDDVCPPYSHGECNRMSSRRAAYEFFEESIWHSRMREVVILKVLQALKGQYTE